MQHATPDTMSLVYKHLEMFNGDSVTYCELMVTDIGHRLVFYRAYVRFVALQKITALEEMTMTEKVSVGAMANDIAKGRMDRKSLIELAKNLIVIEYLLKSQKKN